jgi:UDP-2-acetamido-2,6-beta-L-arabino-hexul-4-ose reductase
LVPVVFASSTQAALDNPYGQSKRAAEDALFALASQHGVPVHLCSGCPMCLASGARPNYNSAVATFCHNVARGLPIQVNDPAAPVNLVYVDDVCQRFVQLLDGAQPALQRADGFEQVGLCTPARWASWPAPSTFADSRTTLMTDRVGTGWCGRCIQHLCQLPAG